MRRLEPRARRCWARGRREVRACLGVPGGEEHVARARIRQSMELLAGD